MDLSQISRTAILTLIARLVTSESKNTDFHDPMARLCFDRLISIASEEEKKWIINRKRFYGGISAHDARAGARRSKIFDGVANRFIADHPQCTVLNLGCGFDTRFWRIAHEHCRYIEIDLPEVIALKREILKDQLCYDLIGCSILEPSWIDLVTAFGNRHFLLLAEGLLMFLPEPDVVLLFQRLSQRFTQAQFTLDMVPEKYLKGVWKVLLRLETRINWGLDVSWVSGIRDPRTIETYAPGLQVREVIKGSAGPIITVSINSA